MTNDSEQTALLALQGPLAVDIIGKVTDTDVSTIEPFRFVLDAEVCGVKLLLSRTGYTGEDGFELYVPADQAAMVWNGLMQGLEKSTGWFQLDLVQGIRCVLKPSCLCMGRNYRQRSLR